MECIFPQKNTLMPINAGIYQNNTSNLVFEPSYNLNPFSNVYYGNHMDKIMIVLY